VHKQVLQDEELGGHYIGDKFLLQDLEKTISIKTGVASITENSAHCLLEIIAQTIDSKAGRRRDVIERHSPTLQ